MKKDNGLKDPKESDEEYWKKQVPEEDGLGDINYHDIDMDIICKFRGINGGVIFATQEKNINCNLPSLEDFFKNLKKVIRMLDESISDKEIDKDDEALF